MTPAETRTLSAENRRKHFRHLSTACAGDDNFSAETPIYRMNTSDRDIEYELITFSLVSLCQG